MNRNKINVGLPLRQRRTFIQFHTVTCNCLLLLMGEYYNVILCTHVENAMLYLPEYFVRLTFTESHAHVETRNLSRSRLGCMLFHITTCPSSIGYKFSRQMKSCFNSVLRSAIHCHKIIMSKIMLGLLTLLYPPEQIFYVKPQTKIIEGRLNGANKRINESSYLK